MLKDYVISYDSFVSSIATKRAINIGIDNVAVSFGKCTDTCDVIMSLDACLAYLWTNKFSCQASYLSYDIVYDGTSVFIPYGMLQLPFFSAEWPMWMKIATLGTRLSGLIATTIDTSSLSSDDADTFRRFTDCTRVNFADVVGARSFAMYAQ
jgi:hypothetical protein